MPWGFENPASCPLGENSATCAAEDWPLNVYAACSWVRATWRPTGSVIVWYTSGAPDHTGNRGWRDDAAGLSVTAPFVVRNAWNARVESETATGALEVLVRVNVPPTPDPGWPARSSCGEDASTPPGGGDCVVPGAESASRTAASTLSSPAPCCSAGAPMSVAVDVRIARTSAGLGLVAWCAARYAWMTSAAAPAMSGEDSLVPPVSWIGWPAQSVKAGDRVHGTQLRSPGATRPTVVSSWANPADENDEMLLLRYVPRSPGRLIPPNVSCW